VANFDEFLIRCNTLNTEGQAKILSKFRAGLRGDLRTELLARSITELKQPTRLLKIYILLGLTTTLGVLIQNQVRLELHCDTLKFSHTSCID